MRVADQIYFGGTILTMDAQDHLVEAVAVRDGTILACGSFREMRALQGPNTRMIDLEGRTMMPGFYDSHSHISYFAWFSDAVDLTSTVHRPVGTVEDCIRILREAIPTQARDGWLVGWNLFDIQDETGAWRLLTRQDLDRVSTDLRVMVYHQSFHQCMLNTRALEAYGINEDTVDPAGGVIEREPGSRRPNGVLFEACCRQSILGPVADFLRITPETIARSTRYYASKGITTANEGVADLWKIDLALEADLRGALATRITFNPRLVDDKTPFPDFVSQCMEKKVLLERESKHLRITAIKLMLDGAIQLRTAFLQEPYCNTEERGYPECSEAVLRERIRTIHQAGIASETHCNGDAAVHWVLNAIEAAQKADPKPELRHILIHSQMISEADLRRIRKLNACVTFFPCHIYHFGDRHADTYIGPERAARLSPLHTAAELGLHWAIHNDAPAFPLDPMMDIHCAVNRRTKGGQILGPQERVSVLQALRAYTIQAAYQYHDENLTGSIEVGKRADFVILEENPLQCAPGHLKDIAVFRTILGGEITYQR